METEKDHISHGPHQGFGFGVQEANVLAPGPSRVSQFYPSCRFTFVPTSRGLSLE